MAPILFFAIQKFPELRPVVDQKFNKDVRPFLLYQLRITKRKLVEFFVDMFMLLHWLLQILKRIYKKMKKLLFSFAVMKLHTLADFGISFVNTLKNSSVSNSHCPSLILLPSSLYKISLANKREAHLSGSDRNISEKIPHGFESEISCPVRNLTKRDRKCQEEFSVSDAIKCSSLNLDLCKKVDLITKGINEKDETPNAHGKKQHESLKQKVNSSGIQNPVSSSSLPRSAGLHNEFSVDDEFDGEEPRNCEPDVGNEQLPSSCDFVAMKPSVAQNEDLPNSDSLHRNDTLTKCNSMIVEPSKCLKINHNDVCSSKIVSDNVEVEVLSLENEILWETTSHGSVSLKDSRSLRSSNLDRGEHSTISSPMEIVDAFSSDASQQMQNSPQKENSYALNRKLPPAVKGNKGRGASVNKSTSEVIIANQDVIARRTRRRKV